MIGWAGHKIVRGIYDMSMFAASSTKAFARKRIIGLFLVLLGVLVCLGRMNAARHKISGFAGIDFRAIYGSCRCVMAGCNPYDSAETRLQFLHQGGTVAEATPPLPGHGPFQPYYVGYPPPALFYLVPFAVLHWPLALYVYIGISLALYVFAAILFADLCSEYGSLTANACLGLFLAVEGKVLMLGQPALIASALLCIALWCLIKNRFLWFGVIGFALSLIMKPPLGGLFLLYFLLATPSYRRRAWQVIAAGLVFCTLALFWFSTHPAMRHWVPDYRTNITNIQAPGNLSDPGPRQTLENEIIDLQTIVSHYRDEPSFYNHVVWAFSGVVLLIWVYPVLRRRPGQEKDLLCLAAIAAFSMLPIYHRVYDSRALLILFPAVALLMQRTRWWGKAAAILTVLTSLLLSDWYPAHSRPASTIIQTFANHPRLQVVFGHPVPLALLAVTIFYLAVLYASPSDLELTRRDDDRQVFDESNSLPAMISRYSSLS